LAHSRSVSFATNEQNLIIENSELEQSYLKISSLGKLLNATTYLGKFFGPSFNFRLDRFVAQNNPILAVENSDQVLTWACIIKHFYARN